MEHQNRGTRKEKTQKEIAAEIGVHPSTVSREYRRNAMPKGGYIDTKAQAKAARAAENRITRLPDCCFGVSNSGL